MHTTHSWDHHFFNLCEAIARNSKCLSRQIGCVIVRDKSVISTGYNGPPSGVTHCDKRHNKDRVFESFVNLCDIDPVIDRCPRRIMGFKSGEGLEYCIAVHAEANAICQAAKNGININNSTLYMNTNTPCKSCLGLLIQSGIKEIVVTDLNLYDKSSEFIIKETGIIIRKFDFI